MRLRLPALLLALALLLGTLAPALADAWKPQKTWVFVVGVLEWHDSTTWASFPKTNRRDAQLVSLLKARGVPADHVVYLQDRDATHDRVIAAYHDLLARTSPGDELVVYFCGHGHKEEDGSGFFVTYDAGDDMHATTWPMASVVGDVQARFKGRRALLLADCCYSGTMSEDVSESEGRVALAGLASSSSSTPSTGAWTFTESVIEGLKGNPVVDLDHDGSVTLDEIARFTEGEMEFGDEQHATFLTSQGFDAGVVMAPATGRAAPRVGEHVEVKTEGDWWRARVIGSGPQGLKVHFYGYETSDDAWVKAADTRTLKAKTWPPGTRVSVQWKKEWYPAVVLKARDGLHYIHYDGYNDTWNEWVGSRRIKPAE